MRIIDKQKDFYDHLAGEFGMDPLYTYVRNSPNPNGPEMDRYREFFQYFTSDKELRYDITKRWYYWADESVFFKRYYGILIKFDLVIGFHRFRFECNRYKDKVSGQIVRDVRCKEIAYNIGNKQYVRETDAPIFVRYPGAFMSVRDSSIIIADPLIKDLGLSKWFDPRDVWNWVVEYLASKKEVESKPLSDKEKVVSHGFDLKTSFRNIK